MRMTIHRLVAWHCLLPQHGCALKVSYQAGQLEQLAVSTLTVWIDDRNNKSVIGHKICVGMLKDGAVVKAGIPNYQIGSASDPAKWFVPSEANIGMPSSSCCCKLGGSQPSYPSSQWCVSWDLFDQFTIYYHTQQSWAFISKVHIIFILAPVSHYKVQYARILCLLTCMVEALYVKQTLNISNSQHARSVAGY